MSDAVDRNDRQIRAAKNQSLFREINERVLSLEANSFSPPSSVATSEWFCECVNETCFEHIGATQAEYEAIREHGARFLVAPSDEHMSPAVERVIEQNDRYWIVEKLGESEAVAKDLDPRARPLPLRT